MRKIGDKKSKTNPTRETARQLTTKSERKQENNRNLLNSKEPYLNYQKNQKIYVEQNQKDNAKDIEWVANGDRKQTIYAHLEKARKQHSFNLPKAKPRKNDRENLLYLI